MPGLYKKEGSADSPSPGHDKPPIDDAATKTVVNKASPLKTATKIMLWFTLAFAILNFLFVDMTLVRGYSGHGRITPFKDSLYEHLVALELTPITAWKLSSYLDVTNPSPLMFIIAFLIIAFIVQKAPAEAQK